MLSIVPNITKSPHLGKTNNIERIGGVYILYTPPMFSELGNIYNFYNPHNSTNPHNTINPILLYNLYTPNNPIHFLDSCDLVDL